MSSVRTARAAARPRFADKLGDYVTLTKPEVTFLVVVCALVGFVVGSVGPLHLGRLLVVVAGTGLVAAGTAALNMVIERADDGLMRRTSRRPIPAGRIRPASALAYGLALAAAGGAGLWVVVNPLASVLALAALAVYLLAYTPLKKRTFLCTAVGAVPGAISPLIGWAGARGTLGAEAWMLFAIQLVWQFPHFLAIAWMYREDYARGGMLMLAPGDGAGDVTFRQIVISSVLLVPASLLPAILGPASLVYAAAAIVLGTALLLVSLDAASRRTAARAKVLLHASVAYLPLLFIVLMLDRLAS